jgi:hypothetical protein
MWRAHLRAVVFDGRLPRPLDFAGLEDAQLRVLGGLTISSTSSPGGNWPAALCLVAAQS